MVNNTLASLVCFVSRPTRFGHRDRRQCHQSCRAECNSGYQTYSRLDIAQWCYTGMHPPGYCRHFRQHGEGCRIRAGRHLWSRLTRPLHFGAGRQNAARRLCFISFHASSLKGAKFGIPWASFWALADQEQLNILLEMVSMIQDAGATIVNGTELPYYNKVVSPDGRNWCVATRSSTCAHQTDN